MKKIITSILLIFISFNVFAHGPSPQKVEKSITINASPDKVWAIVKDFGAVQKWIPLVTDSKVEKKGEDTIRILVLKSGGKVIERLKGIDEEAMKLKYEIVEGAIPVADYNSFIVVAFREAVSIGLFMKLVVSQAFRVSLREKLHGNGTNLNHVSAL